VSKQEMLKIYEGDITNWKQLGGGDQRIKFYSSERGRGTWEVFALWLYGELRRAPVGKFEIVVGGEDARNTVEFNSGSMSLAAPRWADGKSVCALGIRQEDGSVIEPSIANLVGKKYPLARPAVLVLGDTPTGAKKKLVEFMLTAKGQELVKRSELVPISELKEQ
jgi:phosphate transport system substrate-binding protein